MTFNNANTSNQITLLLSNVATLRHTTLFPYLDSQQCRDIIYNVKSVSPLARVWEILAHCVSYMILP